METVATLRPRLSAMVRQVPVWPVYVLGLVPAAWLVFATLTGRLGFDPVRTLEHDLGLLSLRFLLASLCVTPLMRLTRVNLIKFRKPLGLLAFVYVALHFSVWLGLDLQLRWDLIGAEIVKRPYLTIGFAAFVMLIPLAATSWRGAIRRLGAQTWGRLHRLVYPAALLGAVHFVMQEKVWSVESLIYLGIAVGLVASRLMWVRTW